ncbi:MAG: lytic murein transglycosylase, partial [Rhodobiaceae bacterium]|nr:lytic murein transglycosylase [Rhodobiaceae bacterium]
MTLARIFLLLLLTLACFPAFAADRAATERQFSAWLSSTAWPAARATGVSESTFRRETAGLSLDWNLPGIVAPGERPPEVNYQAEFKSPADYFAEKYMAPVVRSGQGLMREWSKTLASVETAYGVPASIIVAIWGRESGFGRVALPKDAVRTLATKAFMSDRPALFLDELVAALKILQDGHIQRAEMKSSWAGALGQPQFMPGKYLGFAVDFDGDGKRDIWRSVPDTLASIGYYLKAHGWQPGARWGVEVELPASVSCTLEGPEKPRPIADWERDGVRPVSGGRLSEKKLGQTGYLMQPAGRHGPAFIVSWNFYVLKLYNESDLYASFVGHAADRIAGRESGPFVTRWQAPSGFSRGAVRQMQLRMESRGVDVGGADGL